MKKLVALFLVILYSASFSGMLWAKDCKASEALKGTPHEIDQTCTAAEGHSTRNESHPLLQFCKLVEVHKEVIVAKKNQTITPLSKPVESTYHTLCALHTRQVMATTLTPKFLPGKLFLHWRVLLI